MKTNKKPFPLAILITPQGIRQRIDPTPDFQRPAVWSTAQKRLLIDTILREYDVPKMYWRKVGDKPDRYDVVDGQQRLRAIWSYVDGEFALSSDADPVNGLSISGCKYDDLPDDLKIQFTQYTLDVVVLEDTDEDEVREMFLRLQNGSSLKAQEKRNAMPGKMRNFVRELTEHPFFSRVQFSNSRFAFDHVAAQLICLELAGEPVNVKDGDLNRMYKEHADFDANSKPARSVKRTLDLMAQIFPERAPELERYNVVALYAVLSELQRGYVIADILPEVREWFFDFEARRHAQEALDVETAESEWVAYKEKVSHSTDAGDSIRFRLDFIMRDLLSRFPNLLQKDNQREFTHLQKMTIFRRDKQRCQVKLKCDGVKVVWDEWHCDHKDPWSRGGKSTVENGQVSCPACNLAKGAN
jgi:hypothetical protein